MRAVTFLSSYAKTGLQVCGIQLAAAQVSRGNGGDHSSFLIVLEASYGACVIADFERAEETCNPVGSLHRPFQGSRFWCSHWDNRMI